eukprot:gene11917-13151_t
MAFGGVLYSFVCLVIRFLIAIAYLCVGAAVFRTLETTNTGSGQAQSHWATKPEINQYFDWFHFAFAATTTIGYGDITPHRNSSKIFYMFYALVGIPVMVWYLALCGQIQTDIYTYVLKRCRTGVWRRNDKSYRDIGPVIISFIILLMFWFIGALLLHKTSKLSILDSIYFWFVTFTTTGFGDIILTGSDYASSSQYTWVVYKWLLLCLVAAVVQSVFVWIHGFNEPKQSMCCMCWHRHDHAAAMSNEEPEALERYNLQLANKQDLVQLHRQASY